MRTIFKSILLSLISCAAIWAQATAQMHGKVQDASGAGVPGVEVKATQTDTNTVRTANSEADGGFLLTNLPLGPYKIEVSKEGFTKYVQSGIVLQVGSDPLVDVPLKVGAVTEQVTVEANANLVETRSSGVSSVMETERILELPLNGRQPTDLISLTGGTVSLGNSTGVRGPIGTPTISVAGGLTYGVGYLLDGANFYNYNGATSNMFPFPDALQEFKVDVSGMNATQGSYASVSAVIKSGTNQFHGDAFEFIRNGDLDARNLFAPVRDNLKRNQFGGTIGGPIKKDKLFFFFGYQGTTDRSTQIESASIPTAQMLAGNWTAYESPACNGGVQKTLGGGIFVNNTINPSQYDPAALNIINRVVASAPAANACGIVEYQQPTSENDNQFVTRADYQATQNNTIFARYFYYHTNVLPASELTQDLLASTTPGSLNTQQSFVVGDTYIISPTMVNSFRIYTTRMYYDNVEPSSSNAFSGCEVGINMYCGYAPGQLLLRVSGAFTLGQSLGNGAVTIGQNFGLSEDLSWVKGAHQLNFGVTPRLDQYRDTDVYFAQGQISGGSEGVTGTALGDFLTGNVGSITQSLPNYEYATQWGMTMYATDTWKMTPRLTFTAGVRWEPWFPENMLSGQTANFSLANFYAGKSSTVFPNSPPGFSYPGDPGFPNGKEGMYDDWRNFAPRLGIAWDPKGDGRTSIRASWGLAYGEVGPRLRDDQVQDAPFLDSTAGTVPLGHGVLGGLDNPWSGTTGGNPFPAVPGTFSPYAVYMVLPSHLPAPTTGTWNVSIQRQIATNWLVSASYIGSETYHLYNEQPINYAVLVPNVDGTALGTCPAGVTTGCDSTSNTNQRRILNLIDPSAQIGNMELLSPTGTASYNGLVLNVQHRFARSFSVQSNYTYSHCISDYDPDPTMSNGGGYNEWTNPLDRRFDRGACDSDRRYVFNLTAVAQVPKFENKALRMVASGWQLAPIYKSQSGQPLDIIAGTDVAENGSLDNVKNNQIQRASCLSNPYGSSAPDAQYLISSAFAQPAIGTLGTCAYNSMTAPRTWLFNVALSRTFQIRERQRIEVRAEAYNLTNSYQPGQCAGNSCQFLPQSGTLSGIGPTASSGFTQLNGATFGKILSAMDPRIMQFSMKYTF
jgi:hypothetical protein